MDNGTYNQIASLIWGIADDCPATGTVSLAGFWLNKLTPGTDIIR